MIHLYYTYLPVILFLGWMTKKWKPPFKNLQITACTVEHPDFLFCIGTQVSPESPWKQFQSTSKWCGHQATMSSPSRAQLWCQIQLVPHLMARHVSLLSTKKHGSERSLGILLNIIRILMRWQCIVSKPSGGSAAAFHSPLIKRLLMGSEEGSPSLTASN